MVYGYTGKIGRIDLTTGSVAVEEPDEVFYRRYMGGANICAYFLLREVATGVDPFSERNKLVFATSMLTGTPIPGSSRSPLG